MKIIQQTNRQYWNSQEQILRRLLMKEQDYRQALPVFLSQHAMIHTIRLETGIRWSFQDEVLQGLTEDQLRFIPKGTPHSAIWSLWHITRIEDATLNVLLADAPQLLNSGNWQAKLETRYAGVGNELSQDEIVEVSRTINVAALLAYRLAVGRRTRKIVRRLSAESLRSAPPPERLQRLSNEQAVSAKASWLLDYWGGHPGANLLLMPATRHAFLHLNEIQRMRSKLRQPK